MLVFALICLIGYGLIILFHGTSLLLPIVVLSLVILVFWAVMQASEARWWGKILGSIFAIGGTAFALAWISRSVTKVHPYSGAETFVLDLVIPTGALALGIFILLKTDGPRNKNLPPRRRPPRRRAGR